MTSRGQARATDDPSKDESKAKLEFENPKDEKLSVGAQFEKPDDPSDPNFVPDQGPPSGPPPPEFTDPALVPNQPPIAPAISPVSILKFRF